MKLNYGYTRTSTTKQHLDRGISEITQYASEHNMKIEHIYTDQQTGKDFERKNYKRLKRKIKPGDNLLLSELDRLGRDRNQILEELRWFREHDIRVMILELPTTLMDFQQFENAAMAKLVMESTNNMLIEMYAMLSEAEMKKRAKRQREGIEAKKARGEWDDYGRPWKMSIDEFQKIYEEGVKKGLSNPKIAAENNIPVSTFYKYLKLL